MSNEDACKVQSETHFKVRLLRLMLEHREPGEHDKLATTAFSLPEEVPEILIDISCQCEKARRSSRCTRLLNQMSWMYVFEGYAAQSSADVS